MANRRNTHRVSSTGRHGSSARRSRSYSSGSQLNDFSGLRGASAGGRQRGRHIRGGSVSNVGKYGSNRRGTRQATTATESFLDKGVKSIPTSNGDILLTRRHFLYGIAGVGALAAASVGAKAVSSAVAAKNEVQVLQVPKDAVTESTDLTEVENGGKLYMAAEVKLPYGTLAWSNDDDYAALLLPTETGSPLTQIGLLRLTSGYYFTVLAQAVGLLEGFEIYDVRATSQGIVWTEVDILEGIWRIYCSPLVDAAIQSPQLLEEGGGDWETPSIAICGTQVFWQVLPKKNGAAKTEPSLLKTASVWAPAEITEVLSSNGRMCTPLYALSDGVVATPRIDTGAVNHQLTLVNAKSLSIDDTMVLPQSMKPLEAGYGATGFTFSFEGIYSYGEGIANLGTYAPKQDVRGGDYSGASWIHFARTPSAPPCWCGGYLIVKSTRSVVSIDTESDTYFVFDLENGADSYGEYLASTGVRKRILTFSNIDDTPINGASEQYCLARVYAAPDA